MNERRSDPVVTVGPEDAPRYGINPAIVKFRAELEAELGRSPSLEETAAAWKARRRAGKDT